MLTAYVQAAMRRATYEILEDDEGFYGEIRGLQGVWGSATSLEGCREELQSALEDWIVFRLRPGLEVPVLNEIDLNTPIITQEAALGASIARGVGSGLLIADCRL
jgi:predicted RNase H-like HicB family nuclease